MAIYWNAPSVERRPSAIVGWRHRPLFERSGNHRLARNRAAARRGAMSCVAHVFFLPRAPAHSYTYANVEKLNGNDEVMAIHEITQLRNNYRKHRPWRPGISPLRISKIVAAHRRPEL